MCERKKENHMRVFNGMLGEEGTKRGVSVKKSEQASKCVSVVRKRGLFYARASVCLCVA